MKYIKLFSLFLSLSFLLNSCEDTNESLVQNRGVAVVPVISDVSPAFYTTDYSDSYIEFKVDLQEGDTVDDAELQVTYKGKTEVIDKIASFPAVINLPAEKVLAVFNLNEDDVKVDDFFLVQVVTSNGGISTRSRASLKVFVTCEFDSDLTVGSYHVISEDMGTEGDVTLTADPDNPYLIAVEGLFEMEGGEPNDVVLYLTINPNNFSVNHDKTLMGVTDPFGEGYGNYTFSPSSGMYKSCTGTFEMAFAVSVNEGSFGVNKYIFTKN